MYNTYYYCSLGRGSTRIQRDCVNALMPIARLEGGLLAPLLAKYFWVFKFVKDEEKADKFTALHNTYAAPVYQLFVDLGGLYVKLGQVSGTFLSCSSRRHEMHANIQDSYFVLMSDFMSSDVSFNTFSEGSAHQGHPRRSHVTAIVALRVMCFN